MDEVETRKALIDVALGEAPADLVLKNARLFHTMSRGDHPVRHRHQTRNDRRHRAAGKGRMADAPSRDLEGRYVTPGFIDPHVHVESSMLTVREFPRPPARASP